MTNTTKTAYNIEDLYFDRKHKTLKLVITQEPETPRKTLTYTELLPTITQTLRGFYTEREKTPRFELTEYAAYTTPVKIGTKPKSTARLTITIN